MPLQANQPVFASAGYWASKGARVEVNCAARTCKTRIYRLFEHKIIYQAGLAKEHSHGE